MRPGASRPCAAGSSVGFGGRLLAGGAAPVCRAAARFPFETGRRRTQSLLWAASRGPTNAAHRPGHGTEGASGPATTAAFPARLGPHSDLLRRRRWHRSAHGASRTGGPDWQTARRLSQNSRSQTGLQFLPKRRPTRQARHRATTSPPATWQALNGSRFHGAGAAGSHPPSGGGGLVGGAAGRRGGLYFWNRGRSASRWPSRFWICITPWSISPR